MITSARFIFESFLLGVGLAMDAFSVSVANGLADRNMSGKKEAGIAGCFGVFQCLMPLIGWSLVLFAMHIFGILTRLIPFIALGLLGFLGIKMILEGVEKRRQSKKDTEAADADSQVPSKKGLTLGKLLLQGVATSIDALSVGLVIAEYSAMEAVTASVIIGATTFVLCLIGIRLGEKASMKLNHIASFIGGGILIAIGIEIFVSHLL